VQNYFNGSYDNNGLMMTLENVTLESLLNKAKELEKKYEWLQAAECYKKASTLSLKDKDFEKKAELQEKMGFCFYRAAFQAETKKNFRISLKLAVEAWEKTIPFYQKSEEPRKETKIFHAKAMVAYESSLLETDLSKRRELFEEYWRLENEVLNDYDKTSDFLHIGRTCYGLSERTLDRQDFEGTWEIIKSSTNEGINYGEKAIEALSKTHDEYGLALAYSSTSLNYLWAVWHRINEESQDEFRRKTIIYSENALMYSKKVGDPYLLGISNSRAALVNWLVKDDLVTALKFSEKTLNYATITKDNLLIGHAYHGISGITFPLTLLYDDPDKQRKGFHKASKYAQNAIHHFHVINMSSGSLGAYRVNVESLTWLASLETNLETKRAILIKAIKVGQEGLKFNERSKGIESRNPLQALSIALYNLSKMETEISKKRQLLKKALKYRKKVIKVLQQVSPLNYFLSSRAQNYLALLQAELAKIEPKKAKKIEFLNAAVLSMENCLRLTEKEGNKNKGLINFWSGRYYYWFGDILSQLYAVTKDEKALVRAIEIYKDSIELFYKTELIAHTAETYWKIARLYDLLVNTVEASVNYELAAKNYIIAAEKIPQLKEFYQDFSLYMQAWSEIEKARYNHTREEYEQARIHYEQAANFHKSSKPWSYLAPNYSAWAQMEKAENLSRKENTRQSKQTFQEALQQFNIAKESINQKNAEISSEDEKEMTLQLLKASDLRGRFCQSRILIEEAKLLDRKGKYLQSSKSYGEAAEKIELIIKQLDSTTERKELGLIVVLCQAWKKMAQAEDLASSDYYLEAAKLFEKAKDLCTTNKTRIWALGNSNFCKGLAAENKFQNTLDRSFHSMATKYVKQAANYYREAGFLFASEYAKAIQRLFDAYLYMNSAEDEVDPEKKTKYYQLAEQLLQIAAGSFISAKQSEKATKVQSILATVREEKALAASLNEVMQAPTIASSTLSFTAPNPTNEVSVGLEQFNHANVQANLVAGVKEVKVGESFCLAVEFVNAGKEAALLTRVEDFIPLDFIVVKKPEIYRLENTCLNMKGKQLAPLKLVEVKLILQPSKKGEYQLKPRVHYLDELGQNKSIQLKSIEIKVEEVLLEDRVSTGTKELDSLLLGGIPEGYAVVLTGSPSDERAFLIKNFLEGIKENQITFHITTEADGLEHLLEKPNFYLFLCNPKPKTQVPDLPNVYKLRSKTDLTNLSISLAKAYRNIDQSIKKRACVEIVSDVLISYQAEATRRWISELITDMGSKGFTMLAVMNPSMHPPDQANAVIDLFDGEINLSQTEDPLECKKSIRVKKLRNQDYIKNPICLL